MSNRWFPDFGVMARSVSEAEYLALQEQVNKLEELNPIPFAQEEQPLQLDIDPLVEAIEQAVATWQAFDPMI